MRFLLDTHTLLWFLAGDPQLPAAVRERIEQPSAQRLVSLASIWEMAIKISLGKLALGIPLRELVHELLPSNGMLLFGISTLHLEQIVTLPLHHRDPFDRMLIAQALVEQIPILGRDSAFDAYPVERWWG